MTFGKALLYFLREAAVNIRRSWRVSSLAILTIAVCLFLGGAFGLLSGNLRDLLDRWRAERKVVIYLESATTPETITNLTVELNQVPGVTRLERVEPDQAMDRFERLFPSLTDVVATSDSLPVSLELSRAKARRRSSMRCWCRSPNGRRSRSSTMIETGWANSRPLSPSAAPSGWCSEPSCWRLRSSPSRASFA